MKQEIYKDIQTYQGLPQLFQEPLPSLPSKPLILSTPLTPEIIITREEFDELSKEDSNKLQENHVPAEKWKTDLLDSYLKKTYCP